MADFLSSLTNTFTGAPAAEAAGKTQAFIGQQQAQLQAALAASQAGGLGALQSARTGALGAIAPAISTARGDISGATPQAITALYGGQTLGAGALTGAQDPALATLQSGVGVAKEAYAPLAAAGARYGEAGAGASGASADALGLNGPEGLARAQAQFQETPGYRFQLEQGLQGAMRGANAGGMLAGGNTLAELQRIGSGLAGQEFDKYRQALAQREGLYTGAESGALGGVGGGVSQAALTGGTAGANILTGTGGRLADLYSGTGKTAADIYATGGRSLADLASKGGLAEAGVYTGTGGAEADLYAKLAQIQGTFAGQTLKPYGDAAAMQAQGEMLGSKNLWDFGMNAVKGAAGAGYIPTGPFGSGGNSFGSPTGAL